MMRNKLFVLGLCALPFISCDYTTYQQGKLLYETNCATCHMPDGSGVAKLYPALNDLKSKKNIIQEIPCIIINGINKPESSLAMAGIKNLSSFEINNIVNYLVNDLNKIDQEFIISETQESLSNCK
jgi:mono/diheme cytochrome c family protein